MEGQSRLVCTTMRMTRGQFHKFGDVRPHLLRIQPKLRADVKMYVAYCFDKVLLCLRYADEDLNISLLLQHCCYKLMRLGPQLFQWLFISRQNIDKDEGLATRRLF